MTMYLLRRRLGISPWDSLYEPIDNRFIKINNPSISSLRETGEECPGEEKKLKEGCSPSSLLH